MDVYVLVLQLFLQRLVEKKTQPYSMGFTASLKEVPGAKGREGGGGGNACCLSLWDTFKVAKLKKVLRVTITTFHTTCLVIQTTVSKCSRKQHQQWQAKIGGQANAWLSIDPFNVPKSFLSPLGKHNRPFRHWDQRRGKPLRGTYVNFVAGSDPGVSILRN